MSEQLSDSVLIGYTEEPRFFDGKFGKMTVKLKVHELQDMIDKYATAINEKGEGGNVWLTLGMSKNGNPYTVVYDPNSEGAKAKRAKKKAEAEAASDDVPV